MSPLELPCLRSCAPSSATKRLSLAWLLVTAPIGAGACADVPPGVALEDSTSSGHASDASTTTSSTGAGVGSDDGSAGSGAVADTGSDTSSDTSDGGADAAPAWNDFIGAHYAARPWARGGLRDPGGAGIGYVPTADGGDDGLAQFESGALPALAELLPQGQATSLAVGGAAEGAMFFDAMQTDAGQQAFATALTARIDGIADLPGVGAWEHRVVFQFGNEIQNPERLGLDLYLS